MQRMRWVAVGLAGFSLAVSAVACGSSDSSTVEGALNQLPEAIADLRLPSVPVPVTIDEKGRISNVAGFDVQIVDGLVESLLGYPLIEDIELLDEKDIDWLQRANIQHVTLALRPKGAFVLVNGKALPYLDWQNVGEEDVMQNLVAFLGRMQYAPGTGEAYLVSPENYKVLRSILPLARNVGLRLDVRLPRHPDAQPIPLPGDEAFDAALTNAELEATPANSASIDLSYKELPDGTWVPSLLGLSTTELQAVARPLGIRIPSWRLRKDIKARFDAEDFRSLGVETRADGVFVVVDGKLMPHLAWSNATLTNLAQVLNQLYPPGTDLPDDAAYVPVLRAVAPMLNDLSLLAVVRFPDDREE